MNINPKKLSFTKTDFDEICIILKAILFDRKSYNINSTIHDYFIRRSSYEDIIYIKLLRCINNQDLSNLDSILDLLNYAFFYCDYLRKSVDNPHRNNIPL